jgi:urease accessory protein
LAATPQSLLKLLQLASPALPIGAFHFSQGLEHAVHADWVHDESTALEWIGGVAQSSLATLDLPVLARLFDAWSRDEAAAVSQWSAFLIAARETEELRAEDRHMGGALAKLLAEFELALAAKTELHRCRMQRTLPYATSFALACAHWGIAREDALTTYAWTWTENQTLAAVKLVPLGQSAGQRILHRLAERIPTWVQHALALTDEELGLSSVMLGVASALHESQYSRLFRS